MRWFTLEPRDPLLVRDGRPFGVGVDGARSQNMVPPSVTAGALRTRVWHAKGGWNIDEAKATPVVGPLLAEIDEQGGMLRCWLSAPRDCALFDPDVEKGERAEDGLRRFALGPTSAWAEGTSSLAPGQLPVGPTLEGGIPKAKPAKSAPAFWSSAEVQTWLGAEPPAASALAPAEVRGPLQHEPRVHVAIDPETGTAKEGKLFQSDGLRFTERSDNGKWSRMALVVGCDHRELSSGFLPLGGERRVSALRPLTGSGPRWPAPEVLGPRGRVLLLTPACFTEGAVPSHIGGARVIAAAVGRPQTLSGWDMAAGGPKPARRFAPAGSVYWVDLSGLTPSDWCAAVHFQSVCSDEQDNRDGFGLAAVGVSA